MYFMYVCISWQTESLENEAEICTGREPYVSLSHMSKKFHRPNSSTLLPPIDTDAAIFSVSLSTAKLFFFFLFPGEVESVNER